MDLRSISSTCDGFQPFSITQYIMRSTNPTRTRHMMDLNHFLQSRRDTRKKTIDQHNFKYDTTS